MPYFQEVIDMQLQGTTAFLENANHSLPPRQFALVKKAVHVLQHNVVYDETMPWGQKRCIVPCAEGFRGIWNWDTAFHCVGVSRFDPQFAMEHMETYCNYQLDNGLFPDVIFASGKIVDNFGKPPVMTWACETVYRRSQDLEFLSRMYPRLAKNVEFWENDRQYNGLFHYDAAPVDGVKRPLDVRYESGWDNSVRWDTEEPELFWAIDLNCYMVMTYNAMAYLSSQLKLDPTVWQEKAVALAQKINQTLWCEELHCYVDRNYRNGTFSRVLTPASFMPLYVGIASPDKASWCAQIAQKKFSYGMPTVAYDDPEHSAGYWRGLTWLNVAYFAAKGLKDYGYCQLADRIRDTILGWVEQDGDRIHENYNSITGEGCGAKHFSWSAVFVLEFILDF